MAPAQQRLDAAAFAVPQINDRLVMEDELTAREGSRELAIADRDGVRPARSRTSPNIGAGKPLDNGARVRPFHAIAASCDRVTRSVRPPSRSSRKIRTSP